MKAITSYIIGINFRFFFVIYYFILFFYYMSDNDNKQNIQEMQKGQKDLGILNTVNSVHKKIIGNELVSQFDVFSVPVKLTLNGKEVYQTCCGGLMYLFVIAACIVLSFFVLFPNGVELNSSIDVVMVPVDNGDTGQSVFDHTSQPIGFKGLRRNGIRILGYTNLTGMLTLNAYLVGSDNTKFPLVVSSDCEDGFQFCIKKNLNPSINIFGNFYDPATYSRYLVIEGKWCDTTDPSCLPSNSYIIETSYSNFIKKKGGQLHEYKTRAYYQITNFAYTTNVTRQVYTTNNRVFGHISNIFSFDVETYLFNDLMSTQVIPQTSLLTPGTYTNTPYTQINIVPNKMTREIKENFDDISNIILFFFSVKETIYLIVFILFIKQYNTNAGLLEVGKSLYYIDNPKTKKKYDFTQGYEIFLACLLYNHPFIKLIHFILTKNGRTFEDLFPNKALCAIKLMRKAEEMLQQNSFYGNLNQLSSMQSEASKKIPLIQQSQQQTNVQQAEMSYFPFIPGDSQDTRKQKQIKREAFEQFCEANQYVSPERKNYVYKVLTNSKLKYMLVHELQKQFQQFVRNVRVQKMENIYNDIEEEEFSEIKVGLHDTSNQHLTGHTMIRT